MLEIKPTGRFKRELKACLRRGYDMDALGAVVDMLARQEKLPEKNRDHDLEGEYEGCRECHITPDWLLIYKVSGDSLVLYLMRTGTHSDLFW